MATEVERPSSLPRLPDISSHSIYTGKFRDRNPDTRAAGKLTATGDAASLCMQTEDRSASPEVVRRFRATIRPDAGQTRIFYGKAYDPHLQWAATMTHGLHTQPSLVAGDLVSPSPKSRFHQGLIDRKEACYHTHQRAPLGKSQNQTPGLPARLNPVTFTFGIQTEKDGSAGELINPYKSWTQVEEESIQGRDLYRRTHMDFYPGEQCNRNYTHDFYNPNSKFGIPTPHDNAGRHVSRTLRWLHDEQAKQAAPIVSKRVDDFRERTQPQLGKVHDPIKDTLNVAPDHTFGILIKPDDFGAGDLLHGRAPSDYLRGKDRMRGVIAAMRQHLKKANYHNFNDILDAFKYYDKDGSGKINIYELREVCHKFNLPVEPELLVQLMDYCDTDKDGQINYMEFSNFLNWKDKLPSGFPPVSAPCGGKKDKDAALIAKSPQNLESTPQQLQKQIDEAIGAHRTSASMINATVGSQSTKGYRTYGVPTVRTDLPAPLIRRIDDRANYGDESNAYGLTNPSIFSTHGVHEKDLLIPRERHEIHEIMTNVGVQMTLDTFDNLYDMAAKQHPKGHVSVESFRNVLDECQALKLQKEDVV